MLSKMRSLSIKLTIIYIVSVFLIIGGTITYLEYQNHQRDIRDAVLDAEQGVGFINGTTPNSADSQPYYTNREYFITAADINNRMARFTQLDGISGFDGPITIDSWIYYNVTFSIYKPGNTQQIGPVTILRSDFPTTIGVDNTRPRTNDFYYMSVPDHDNLIILVSLNHLTFPVVSWQQKLESDVRMVLPIVLIFSVIFGFLISLLTVSPLKRITRAAEGLSHSDLSQRVKYKSNDEIGRLAVSFNTMANRLEDAFSAQKRFISDAAHELRTPLASMKTSVTKAQTGERNTGEQQKLLDFLSGRIAHMETLVNDLLFLSRVDEGKFKPNAAVLDVSKLLVEAEDSFRCLFEDKDIKFTADIAPDLSVKAERTLILRVISNLLDNAAKNTPAGGTVFLKASRQNDDVIITVGDTGSGISPEYLPHIFERFYKVPGSAGANNGYGLGLAISKSIINSIGGEISVQSETGKGSIFTVKLPQSDPQSL
jgi:signal transduction histidine kinase